MSDNIYIHTEDIHNFSAAEELLPFIIELVHPKSMLDIGCGIGTWLAVAQNLGIKDIVGIDGEYVDRRLLKIPLEKFIPIDLNTRVNLKRKFDIVLCLEVAEHLPIVSTENLIDTLTCHSDFIIFSAALPGQGGQNHINEQWPRFYEHLFLERDFIAYDILRPKFWDNSKIEWWYRQNMVIFAKKNIPVFEGISPSKTLMNLVHPELLLLKDEKINQLNSKLYDEAAFPEFSTSFKRLIKSVIKPKLVFNRAKKLH